MLAAAGLLALLAVTGCPNSKTNQEGADFAADERSTMREPSAQAEAQPVPGNATESLAPGDQQPKVQNPPGVVTADFKVEGMTCEDCSKAIEGTLIRLEGVSTVSADDKNGTARVQYDPGRCTPDQIVDAINKLKYTATLVTVSEPGPEKSGS
jgi:copper chaperone CopZ